MNAKPYIFFSFLSLVILFTGSLSAQVSVNILTEEVETLQSRELWQLEIESNFPQQQEVFIKAWVSLADGSTFWAAQSKGWMLPSGITSLQAKDLVISEVALADAPVSDSLTDGPQLFCIEVIDARSRHLLGQHCKMITILDPGKKAPEKRLALGGTSRLTTQYSNQQLLFQRTPASYIRWELMPTLSWEGLPIQGQLMLSTEHQPGTYEINSFSINLDPQQIQQWLQQKAKDKIQKAMADKAKGLPFDKKLLDRLDGLTHLDKQAALAKLQDRFPDFDPQQAEEILQKVEELDRVEEVLKQATFSKMEQEWSRETEGLDWNKAEAVQRFQDSLYAHHPEKYEQFTSLKSKYDTYQKLKIKAESLKPYLAKAKKLQNYREELNAFKQEKANDWEKHLKDPQKLKKLGFLKGKDKVLGKLDRFALGLHYPEMTTLSMEGVGVKGLQFAVAPGKTYAAVSIGQMMAPGWSFDSTQQGVATQSLTARAGIGHPQGNHLHLVFADFKERERNNKTAHLAPAFRHNQLFGVTSHLSFLKDRIQLGGEVMQTALSAESNDLGGTVIQPIWTQGGTGEVAPTTAWSLSAQVALAQSTQIAGHYEHTPPSYISLGRPFLVADRQRYEFSLSQSFWEDKVSLNLFHRRDGDNLLPYKELQSVTRATGIQLAIRPGRNWPSLQLSYAPQAQQSFGQDSVSFTQDNFSRDLLSLHLHHGYQIGKAQLQSTFMLNGQFGRETDLEDAFASQMATFRQMVAFPSAWALNAGLSYMHFRLPTQEMTIKQAELSGQFPIGKAFASLGALGAQELVEAQLSSRYGGFVETRLPILQRFQFSLRLEHSTYSSTNNSFTQADRFLARSSLQFQW